MKILLCHERFLFRYGVDRVLLALAREFRRRGHDVTLLGQAFDRTAEAPECADRIVRVPVPADTLAADVEAAAWLADHWEEHFGGDRRPDVVLDAGWPFFSAIPIFESRGCRVVYQDHGIIPADGMPEIGWRTLHLIGELKQTFLRVVTAVVAVSDFVRDSQSRVCAPRERPLEVIANGIDHVMTPDSGTPPAGAAFLPACTVPPAGVPRILCTGRFEPGLYKQSELVFALEQRIRGWAPEAWVGAFASREAIETAGGRGPASRVVPLDQPTDEAMVRLVRACDVIVCFSRWEGFNLPLAEAQVLGRPCLVFNLGAHPEVVASPWQLCADLDEMAAKVRALVEGRAPAEIRDGSVFRAWRAERERTWSSVAGRYLALFEKVVREGCGLPADGPRHTRDAHLCAVSGHGRPAVLMDVTNAARDPSNSGCVRVTRRLAAEWQAYLDVTFVVWDREPGAFRFPTPAEFIQLGAYRGPVRPEVHAVSSPGAPAYLEPWLTRRAPPAGHESPEGLRESPGWILLPEIRHRPDLWPILEFAARIRLRTASIFHDAIPLVRPELVPDPAYREGHADYMRGLGRVDVSVANSRASADALRTFWRDEGLSGRVAACLLPGGLPGVRPVPGDPREPAAGPETEGAAPFLLMVSTLEPRKGFRRLIEAFLAARARARRSDWRLVLVGGRQWWSGDISRFVEDAVQAHPGITWLEDAPDDRLGQLYRACAFTVYASEIEGFGLPIMESVWHGRPCLCHDAGVMRELAAGGGCLAADLMEPAAFQAALLGLMDDDALRDRLAAECRARSVKRWPDYAAEFWARLAFTRWAELEAPASRAAGASDGPAAAVAGRLSFIIPTFNRLDLLQVCLRTLRETLPAGLDAEIIVVDDASGDGTRAWLERGHGSTEGVRILRHATNRGYAVSVNHAARVATGEHLVMLNHDLIFRPRWLEPMLGAWRQRPGCFAVGNLQCSARDGSLDHGGITFDPSGHPDHFRADLAWIQGRPVREFPAVTFACALVDRARFLALDGLDEQFLNGFEDVDLCLRARSQGWPSLVATGSVVDHQISATPGRKLAEAENRRRFFARWQPMTVVLGRDWEERLAWERCGGAGLPGDARPSGPWRVLVDLTAVDGAAAGAISGGIAREVAGLLQPRSGPQYLPLLVATPAQCQAMETTLRAAGIGREDVEEWCLSEQDAPAAEARGARVIGGPAITVARRLQSDVVYAPAGASMLASPDIPTLLPPDQGLTRGRMTPLSLQCFRGASAGSLRERLGEVVRDFSVGGVTWRWSEASGCPAAEAAPGGFVIRDAREATLAEVLFCIDEPVRWEESVPLVEIRGWCLHRIGEPPTEIFVRTTSGREWRGVMGRARPDVAAAFPDIASAGTSGFSVRVAAPRESFELWAAGAGYVVRLRQWIVRPRAAD